jgi:hypothetical protein
MIRALKIAGWVVLGWVVGSFVGMAASYLWFYGIGASGQNIVYVNLMIGLGSIALFTWYGVRRTRKAAPSA